MTLLGLIALTLVSRRELARRGLLPDIADDLVFAMAVAGTVGARLWFAISHPGIYAGDLRAVLELSPSALALEGAVLGGTIGGLLLIWRRHLPLFQVADALAPGLALLQGFFNLGDFLSGASYGLEVAAPWAAAFGGRHPVQLYGVGLALVAFGILWERRRTSPFPGFTLLLYLLIISLGALFTEGVRATGATVGGYRLGQLQALVTIPILLGLIEMGYRRAGRYR